MVEPGQGSKREGIQHISAGDLGRSPATLTNCMASGNMVIALNFCFICKMGESGDSWCPCALVSAKEVVAEPQLLGVKEKPVQSCGAWPPVSCPGPICTFSPV